MSRDMKEKYKAKTIGFFKQIGFSMDQDESHQTWDEQIMNAAAFAVYLIALQKTEITTLNDEVFRKEATERDVPF